SSNNGWYGIHALYEARRRTLPAPLVRRRGGRFPRRCTARRVKFRRRCARECLASPAIHIPGQLELEWRETCRSLTAYSFSFRLDELDIAAALGGHASVISPVLDDRPQ